MGKRDSLMADAVFEGGGVKGIGFVGAIAVAEEKGYQWVNVAGTSAGAIVAALLAAGYSAAEMKEVIEDLNYNRFKDAGLLDRVPLAGPVASLIFETDISQGRLLVLPQDIADFGIRPEDLNVATAVRMSMSIPFFFEPIALRNMKTNQVSYIVDGGLLSNFPVWLFDYEGDMPEWPTFGFKLVEPGEETPHKVRGPITLLAALFSTMMEAHDARHIAEEQFVRTIPIPSLGVGTTEFDISAEKTGALYRSGRQAAEKFFASWNFTEYIEKYRGGKSQR